MIALGIRNLRDYRTLGPVTFARDMLGLDPSAAWQVLYARVPDGVGRVGAVDTSCGWMDPLILWRAACWPHASVLVVVPSTLTSEVWIDGLRARMLGTPLDGVFRVSVMRTELLRRDAPETAYVAAVQPQLADVGDLVRNIEQPLTIVVPFLRWIPTCYLRQLYEVMAQRRDGLLLVNDAPSAETTPNV